MRNPPFLLLLGRQVLLAASLALIAPGSAVAADAADADAGAADSCVGKARLHGLEFGPDDATLDAADAVILDLVLAGLKERCPTQTIRVEGHTDASGSPAYNQALSLRRAEAVKAYFVAHGFPAERLRAVGYGSSRPLTQTATPAAQAMNRRVTLVAQSQ